MFTDEARFGRINRPRPCWAPIGTRPEVASQLIREYIYLYGAACPKDGTCVYLIMPTSNTACFQIFLNVLSRNLPGRISSWFSTAPPTIAAKSSRFPITSRCSSCRPIRQSSTRRKISGMKSVRNSSRTTPSNPSTPCAPNSNRRSSISNVIQNSSNQSRHSHISSSHPDVEMVSDIMTLLLPFPSEVAVGVTEDQADHQLRQHMARLGGQRLPLRRLRRGVGRVAEQIELTCIAVRMAMSGRRARHR